MKAYVKHKVAPGDTLSGIARKYNTTVYTICMSNPIIKDPNLIVDGWILDIPVAEVDEDINKISTAVENCLNDIEKLPSFKKVMELL